MTMRGQERACAIVSRACAQNLDFWNDVIQPAYDVIGHSHTQVDGRLTCQFDDGERGHPPSSKASTAELVLPNCGKRRSERHRLLPLNHRQWRSTLDDVINSIMGRKNASGLSYPSFTYSSHIYLYQSIE